MRKLILVLATTLVACLPVLAQESVLSEQVQEITLENGLRIFVLQRDFSPTFSAIYKFDVGAALEPKGKSGIAHLLEHMMFKGTEEFGTLDAKAERKIMDRLARLHDELRRELDKGESPFSAVDQARVDRLREEIRELTDEHKRLIVKNELDELFKRAGSGGKNAGTGADGTSYFVQMPANQLETWFHLESSRLLRPVFREFYSERDVVESERRENHESRAEGRAYEAMSHLLFKAHPYGVPVIGWTSDIQHYTRRDAEAFFRRFYAPNNCVMTLVGDVDPAEVERLARKYFGDWERQDLPPTRVTQEPQQTGERRAVVEFDAEPSLMMGWVTVPEGHPDSYALEVLGSILGAMRSARLERSLVHEQGLASELQAYHMAQKYGGSFVIGGTPRQGVEVTVLEKGIRDALDRIREEGVTAQELERAKVSVDVRRVRRLQSNLWLGFLITSAVQSAGRVNYIEEYETSLEAVTAEQVLEVARRYLTPSRTCVVEVRRPAEPGERRPPRRVTDFHHSREGTPGDRGALHSKAYHKLMKRIDRAPPVEITVPEVGKDVRREELPGGITVLLKEDHTIPAISMRMTWLGGANTTPVEELAPFEFAADLLVDGGTGSLTPEELEERLDELGMTFRLSLGETQSSARFWSLSRNFAESFDLAMEMLRSPRLDPQRLEVLKAQHVRSMKRRQESPDWGGWLLANQVLHGDHPRLGHVTTKQQAEAVTPDEIRAVLDRYLGAGNLYVTAVGDFDADDLMRTLDEKLGGWNPDVETTRDWLTRKPTIRPGVFTLDRDIPQPAVHIQLEMELDRTAPAEEHAALEILNDILGGSGFRSRLMERMRSDEGLTYGVYSWIEHQGRPGVPGALRIAFQTRSDAVARAVEIVAEELEKVRSRGVTDEEVAEQIQSWRNRFIFRFENPFFSVARLMAHELDDRPYDHDQQVLEEVRKVTPALVQTVARKYLDPSKVTISVYGTMTAESEEVLAERYDLTELSKEEVFKGGY